MKFDFTQEPGKTKNIIKKTENYKPLISIIMASYNSQKYIEQTVYSVLSQTFTDYELLIIDDGSTNKESLEILENLEKLDDRIKVFHKENEGLAATRDFGAKKSSEDAKYLFILDDDDLIENTCLEYFFCTLETNTEASWAYSDSVGFMGNKYVWNKRFDSDKMKKQNDLTATALIRKEDFFEVGGYGIKEKSINEDWIFWLKFIEKGKYPVKVSSYEFWYRRKNNEGELAKSKQNRSKTLSYIKEIGSNIHNKVNAINYPKYNFNWDKIVEKIDSIPNQKQNKNNKINVLMIIPWMVTGGADRFNLELLNKIDKEKFDFTVILTEPAINNYKQLFKKVSTVYDLTAFLDQKYWFAFINYIIEKNNIDIIFNTNSEVGYSMLPLIKAKHTDIPILDYVHIEEWYNRNGGYSRDSSSVSSVIDKTLVCNENSRKILIDYFNRKPEEIKTVYIGVDEKIFNPNNYEVLKEKYKVPKDKIIISYICRITEQKRPFLLLEVIKKLKYKRDDFVFLIIGDGNLLDKMRSEAKKYNLTSCIMFFGNKENTQEFYKMSDITINTSIKEGIALTTYESMTMEVPVISSDVGGQKELINEDVGVIVPCMQDEKDILNYNYADEEVNSYVDAINKVANDLEKYKENARKRILEKFTIDKMIDEMSKIFIEIKENPNKEKIENGKALEKQINLCKELILKTFLEMQGKYLWECNEYQKNMGYVKNNYRKELFKDRMWKFPPYRFFIRVLQKTGIIRTIKKITSKEE